MGASPFPKPFHRLPKFLSDHSAASSCIVPRLIDEKGTWALLYYAWYLDYRQSLPS